MSTVPELQIYVTISGSILSSFKCVKYWIPNIAVSRLHHKRWMPSFHQHFSQEPVKQLAAGQKKPFPLSYTCHHISKSTLTSRFLQPLVTCIFYKYQSPHASLLALLIPHPYYASSQAASANSPSFHCNITPDNWQDSPPFLLSSLLWDSPDSRQSACFPLLSTMKSPPPMERSFWWFLHCPLALLIHSTARCYAHC